MLIYGAYGYTGSLIVEDALEQGLRPLLAGRDAGKLKPLAERSACRSKHSICRTEQHWTRP